jgi:drug/metabolite transporter (DMT)-like permease
LSYFFHKALIQVAYKLLTPPISISPAESQIGGQATFTVLLAYFLGKTSLNLTMICSIVVVILGVVCSCIPLWSQPENVEPTILDHFLPGLSQLFGVLLVLLSAAAAAGRAVLEEIIMLEEDRLSPFTFASATCAVSSAIVAVLLLLAQLLPGLDNGVQVVRRQQPDDTGNAGDICVTMCIIRLSRGALDGGACS